MEILRACNRSIKPTNTGLFKHKPILQTRKVKPLHTNWLSQSNEVTSMQKTIHIALGQCLVAMTTWLLATSPVWAQTNTPSPNAGAAANNALAQIAQQWIDQAMTTGGSLSQAALRPEVIIGQLDPRLQLAPCARIEPYLPPNTQLWGRTRIGLKCTEGSVLWHVFLPVTVKAWGPAWVVQQSIQPGTVLSLEHVKQVSDIDWAESRSPILASAQQWLGMQTTFALSPGQALRQNAVKAPQLFQAGSPVRVSTIGGGFEISTEGQALGSGQLGQHVQVKLQNGKIITGAVTGEGSFVVRQ
jgi:flagellar basal body P-ring formation protein FlgA